MDKIENGHSVLRDIDLRGLDNGLHVIRVRVFLETQGRPGVFNKLIAFFYLNRPVRGRVIDGNLSEEGTPVATQTRNPSSNLNRLDALYMHNDDQYLCVGLAGRVDPAENLTNGVAIFLDVDYGQGTGVRNFALLADDSGPAPRLLSNGQVTAPNGFGAEYAMGVFRHSALHSAPEAFFTGQEVLPPVVGAQAGFYWINPNSLNRLEGRPARIIWNPRPNPTDPPRGLEIAVPLRTLYPNGLPTNTQLGSVASLLTTGETGNTLPSGDPRRGSYGGRLPATSWISNQFLPPQSNVVGDPGFSSVTLQNVVAYSFRQAQTVARANYRLRLDPVQLDPATGNYYQTGLLKNRSTVSFEAPIFLLVRLPQGVELVNRTDLSLLEPGTPYLLLGTSPLRPNRRVFSGWSIAPPLPLRFNRPSRCS